MKTKAYILLFIFSITFLGLIKLFQPIYKGYFKTIISNESVKTTTIVLSESEMNVIKNHELFNDDEFIYKNNQYDIKSISFVNNTYKIICKIDNEELAFNKLIDEMIKLVNGNQDEKNKCQTELASESFYSLLASINHELKPIFLYYTNSNLSYHFSDKSANKSSIPQPPRIN